MPTPETAARSEILLEDDFAGGLRAGPGQPWRLRPVPGFPEGDGLPVTDAHGLSVAPPARSSSGAPAFGVPGQDLAEGDHLRWALFANQDAPGGMPGYPLGEDGALTLEATVQLAAFGLDGHPYGEAVPDPRRDLRLGSAAVICMDRSTGLVFDFILTDRCLFAVYERLAWPGTDHAGFSYAVPIADRSPEDEHRLSVGYDRATGVVTWRLEGETVLGVDDLGGRLPDGAAFALRDNGKPPAPARPEQVTCGVALFTEKVFGQGVRLGVRRIAISARRR